MDNPLRIGAGVVDYALVFVFSISLDFFMSGRSLAARVTGLAFISANLGAVEIIGMSANGAQLPWFQSPPKP